MLRFLLALAALGTASAASAQIATYTFENTRAAATVAAGATASTAVYGPGLNTATFVAGQSGLATSAAGFESAGSLNTAVRSDYLDVTVTAGSGKVLMPGLFTFAVKSGVNGPTRLDVRTSADGFAASVGTLTNPTAGAATFTPYSVDLSAATYQNRPTLSVRIYAYKSSGSAGTFAIDDVSVGGTVVTPATEVATLVFAPTSGQVIEGGTTTLTVQLGIINDTTPAGLNAAVSATDRKSVV